MAILDRIEPAYKPWTPSSAGIATDDDGTYEGRHRVPDIAGRRFSMLRMFYAARHRRR